MAAGAKNMMSERRSMENKIPDLFAFRDEMLWKAHLKYRERLNVNSEKSETAL